LANLVNDVHHDDGTSVVRPEPAGSGATTG
jgi:hypothetical protein